MRISTGDMRCGYLAAPGTEVDSMSAFGSHLKAHGLTLPRDCSLKMMVEWGWITPILRVALSCAAFDSWDNFPELSMRGTGSCPDDERWTLTLWINAVTSPMRPADDDPTWWMYFLDDPSEPLTKKVVAHVIDPGNPTLLPQSFKHASSGREIAPWMDFFAYWQAYQVAELLGAVSFVLRATPGFGKRIAGGEKTTLVIVQASIERVRSRWRRRRSTYQWLSRFRVILAAWSSTDRPWSDVETAAHALAAKYRLTGPRVVAKIRNVLLTTWQDWTNLGEVALPGGNELRALLRQDIEYALALAEILSGSRPDFLAPYWTYSDRQCRGWAQLIDAFPREAELARYRFPERALMYLEEHVALSPSPFSLDAAEIRDLIAAYWSRSRPLRRFCLAFYRLHEELKGQDLGAEEQVVRSNERIEQLLLTMLNAERVVVSIHRARNGDGPYRELPRIARDQLNFTLSKFRLAGGDVGRKSMKAAKSLLAERGGLKRQRPPVKTSGGVLPTLSRWLRSLSPRTLRRQWRTRRRAEELIETHANLHDLDSRGNQILVGAGDVGSGSAQADYFVAAFVNFVIARNYAAHHDSLDDRLIFPNELDVAEHQGHVALASALSVVITCLQLDRRRKAHSHRGSA